MEWLYLTLSIIVPLLILNLIANHYERKHRIQHLRILDCGSIYIPKTNLAP